MTPNMPHPDPARFVRDIDNPFLSYRPGTTFVYEDRASGEEVRVSVTHRTKVVDGVTCVVVHDTARANGFVIEDTFDWYAQDDTGNVWYFGEATAEFEPGNPRPINNNGAWKAGVGGAEAGIVMLAQPELGDRYAQETAPGIAEDRVVVRALDAQVDVRYGSFDGALRTRDINPLDQSSNAKFYVQGVGEVLATAPDGGREELVRILVNGRAGNDDLTGYAGGDSMNGRAGDDRLAGLAGNDRILGRDGDDHLLGGAGFDRLAGGRGNDRLTGGGNGDTFVFRGLSNGIADTDTITDYNAGQIDALDLVGGVGAVVSQTLVSGVWQLALAGDGDIILLPGVVDVDGDGNVTDELLFT